MDLSNFEEVIAFAIEREIEAQDFYQRAQDLAFGDAAKQMFAEFKQEEVKHQKILEKVKADGADDYVLKPIPNLKISDFLIDIPFKPDMPIADIIHLAVKKEEKAHLLYKHLADNASDGALKRTFDILAAEELRHKNKFEIMYDEQVLREN